MICGTLLSIIRGLRRHRQANRCSGSNSEVESDETSESDLSNLTNTNESEHSGTETEELITMARRTGESANNDCLFSTNDEEELLQDFYKLASIPEPPAALTGPTAVEFVKTAGRLANIFVANPFAKNLAIILGLPKLVLAAHKTKKNVAPAKRRLRAYPTESVISDALDHRRRTGTATNNQDIRTAVAKQTRQGRISRAARLLEDSLGTAPLDDDTMDRLQALHPHEQPLLFSGSAPAPINVAQHHVNRAIRRIKRDSSGGISG